MSGRKVKSEKVWYTGELDKETGQMDMVFHILIEYENGDLSKYNYKGVLQ